MTQSFGQGESNGQPNLNKSNRTPNPISLTKSENTMVGHFSISCGVRYTFLHNNRTDFTGCSINSCGTEDEVNLQTCFSNKIFNIYIGLMKKICF